MKAGDSSASRRVESSRVEWRAKANENLERAWKIPTQRLEIAAAKAKETERAGRLSENRSVCWPLRICDIWRNVNLNLTRESKRGNVGGRAGQEGGGAEGGWC